MTAGFNRYRSFPTDAEESARASGARAVTPLHYLRGERESGDIDTHVRDFRDVGVARAEQGKDPDAGRLAREESPRENWRIIESFAGTLDH